MVIRYIILAGMVGTASLAQAGPVNFGGLGGAVKSTFAVGATTKVGEFGRGDGAPTASSAPVYYTGGDSSPGGGAPFPVAAPAPALVPAAPAVIADSTPRADDVAAETPALQAPTAPAADIGNAEELLEVLIPPTGVPDADKLPTALAPVAAAEGEVPEPATGFLMLAGLLGAGALSRRRNSSRQM